MDDSTVVDYIMSVMLFFPMGTALLWELGVYETLFEEGDSDAPSAEGRAP